MSLRQIRRVQQLAHSNHGGQKSDEGSASESGNESPVVVKKSVFRRLQESDSSSSSSSDSEPEPRMETYIAPARPINPTPAPGLPRKTPKQKKKPSPTPDPRKSVLDSSLDLNIHLLNPSSELRRIFGRSAHSGATRTKRLISTRKHWLIQPDTNWPMVIPFSFKMVSCPDGSFGLVPENDYERKLEILSRIVITHDIEALYHFVEFNPFHAHGLIQLASVLIGHRSEYEAAFNLVKRAIYAYQSAFLPAFHPSKSVVLSPDSMFSSSLLRALLLYSNLLAGQGCVRTSLEVMKLVYAMDGGMIRGCPRSHALLHLDTLALKCGQLEWVLKFGVENGLVDILPGFALAAVVALHAKHGGDMSSPEEKDIQKMKKQYSKKSINSESTPLTALIRSVSVFPDLFRQLTDISITNHTPDPFTYKLIRAFTSKGGIDVVKSNEKFVTWMTGVVKDAKEFQKVTVKRPDWLERACADITATEFAWGSGTAYTEPSTILNDETEIINMYSNEGVGSTQRENAPTVPTHPVSLDSNPIAAFFQTLLPWATIDRTGTEAAPVTGASLLEHLRTTLGMNPDPHEEALIQDRDSEDENTESHSSESEEEIRME